MPEFGMPEIGNRNRKSEMRLLPARSAGSDHFKDKKQKSRLISFFYCEQETFMNLSINSTEDPLALDSMSFVVVCFQNLLSSISTIYSGFFLYRFVSLSYITVHSRSRGQRNVRSAKVHYPHGRISR